ncbi:MAG: GAF domain-containing protein [Deltaproteobacteria bacterium]|nr:GAF domain-containing protein [Deltaproteobacteria bacterium]
MNREAERVDGDLARLREALARSEAELIERSLELRGLRREVQAMGHELLVYREIESVAREDFFIDALIERLLSHVLGVMGVGSGALALLEREAFVYRAAAKVGGVVVGQVVPPGEGIAGWVGVTGRPYLLVPPDGDGGGVPAATEHWDARHDAHEVAKPAVRPHSLVAAPLLGAGGKVLGVVVALAGPDRGPGFGRTDLERFARLAEQAAVVLSTARLFHEARRVSRQSKLLTEVSMLLNSTLAEKEVRRRAMEAAARLLDCDVSSLLLLDPETGELYFEVALGEAGAKVKEVRLKRGEGIAGWVAEHNEAVLIPDCTKDPRFAGHVDRKSEFQTRNMVCVPVTIKGRMLGVLQGINKRNRRTFDEYDLNVLTMLSNEVAIAIDNAQTHEKLRRSFSQTAQALAEAIEVRDPYTGGHTKRVTDFSEAIARRLGIEEQEIENIKLSAVLHDIGKIGVEDKVLRKPGRLDDAEYDAIKKHPSYGAEILGPVEQMRSVIPGMLHHHERYDGRGYPRGLKGDEIPESARIIAVADTFDAMASDRPYRKGLDPEVALAEIQKCSGTQFDPRVVEAFVAAYGAGEIVSQRAREEKTREEEHAPQSH